MSKGNSYYQTLEALYFYIWVTLKPLKYGIRPYLLPHLISVLFTKNKSYEESMEKVGKLLGEIFPSESKFI